MTPSPDPAAADPSTERCESCGADAGDVVAVHRMYVTPGAWDQEEKVEVVDEVERWCSVCRTHYPHQELGAGEGQAGGEQAG